MPLAGIDVSHHNGAVWWPDVAASGVRFAYVRTGDGDVRDRTFADNWRDSRRAGVLRGAYHYVRPHDPQAQADALCDAIGAAGGLCVDDLPPAADVETPDGKTPHAVVECALAFAQRVETRLGRALVLYTNPATAAALGVEFARLAHRYPTLWLAHYGVRVPRVPAPYFVAAFWQHACDAVVPGVRGPCDANVYPGDERGLRALIAMSEVMAS